MQIPPPVSAGRRNLLVPEATPNGNNSPLCGSGSGSKVAAHKLQITENSKFEDNQLAMIPFMEEGPKSESDSNTSEDQQQPSIWFSVVSKIEADPSQKLNFLTPKEVNSKTTFDIDLAVNELDQRR